MTLLFGVIGTVGTIASVISLVIVLYDRKIDKKKSEPSAATDSSQDA